MSRRDPVTRTHITRRNRRRVTRRLLIEHQSAQWPAPVKQVHQCSFKDRPGHVLAGICTGRCVESERACRSRIAPLAEARSDGSLLLETLVSRCTDRELRDPTFAGSLLSDQRWLAIERAYVRDGALCRGVTVSPRRVGRELITPGQPQELAGARRDQRQSASEGSQSIGYAQDRLSSASTTA